MNGKGRSHQQPQARFLMGIESRTDTAHSRRASDFADIQEGVVAGKVREIAIPREVGDSVVYHALQRLASSEQAWGHLSETATIR